MRKSVHKNPTGVSGVTGDKLENRQRNDVLMLEGLRWCVRCEQAKPITDFYLRRGRYYETRCRNCRNTRQREAHRQNPEKYREYTKEWRAKNQHKLRAIRRKWTIATYGLTEQEYNKMLAIQGGVCASCGDGPTRGYLVIDHDHGTNKVRGLLCDRCNMALGMLKDDLKRIRALYYYIERSTCKSGLSVQGGVSLTTNADGAA